ncbi:hypothetical protein CGLAMM_11400 [Acetobacteraceae bacterium EV16G]
MLALRDKMQELLQQVQLIQAQQKQASNNEALRPRRADARAACRTRPHPQQGGPARDGGLEGWNGRPWGRSPLIRKRWKAMRPCDIPMRVTCRMIIRPTHLTLFKV